MPFDAKVMPLFCIFECIFYERDYLFFAVETIAWNASKILLVEVVSKHLMFLSY
jgi:hypothetical protein